MQLQMSLRVVAVGVDEHDGLPCTEHGRPGANSHNERWAHERRQHVVGAMAPRAVAVSIPVVAGKETFDGLPKV
jgi:hypothetical protein